MCAFVGRYDTWSGRLLFFGGKYHCNDVGPLNLLTKSCISSRHIELLIEAKSGRIWSLTHNGLMKSVPTWLCFAWIFQSPCNHYMLHLSNAFAKKFWGSSASHPGWVWVPMCFGDCALAHLQGSWVRRVTLDLNLAMDLPILKSASTANWTSLLVSIQWKPAGLSSLVLIS